MTPLAAARRFVGKAAMVTGAGSGIGAACARRLASEGAKVGILDIDAAGAEAVAQQIVAEGGQALPVRTDVTDFESVRRATGQVRDAFGSLDVAVNNAGIGGPILSLADMPLDQWASTLAVNLTGVFHCLKAQLPVMGAQGAGAIVNMASIMGTVGSPNGGAYVASKHGVIGLTKVAALEFGGRGVRVNAVGPTFVRTPLSLSLLDEGRFAALEPMHALGRLPTMEDVAMLVAFLASDEARSITGSLHLVDAGYTAV